MNDPIERIARPEAAALPAYHAGLAAERVRERFGLTRIARLASNENPLGASPRVGQALAGLAQQVATYPDAESVALRGALAALTGVDAARIVLGNGSENIIELLCEVFIKPGDRVVTVTPSFGLHEIYPRMMGGEAIKVPVTAAMEFDVDAMIAALQSGGVRMLMFANPSNPVGCMMGRAAFARLVEAAPQDCMLVIDEAYFEYASADPDYPDSLAMLAAQPRPWIVLRTFSKAYGLAGLRVGYGLCCSQTLAHLLNRVRGPFNINLAAQLAAEAAVADQDHVRRSVAHVEAERAQLAAALRGMGLQLAPSHANLLFVNVGRDASTFAEQLLAHGVIIKGWREEGFRQWLRVSIGSQEDNALFLAATERELAA